MNVSVFGLGYVGSVSAASLASDGHHVVGVDVSAEKVAAINAGRSPIVEPGLDALLSRTVHDKQFEATTDTARAVRDTDVSLVCVGTPSRRNGSLDLTYLTRVCEQIGAVLRDKPAYHVVVIRSTVLPGTTHEVVIPTLERESGKKYGEGFGVSVNPEFLREGSALDDFRKPPVTLVGHNHAADASGTIALYQAIDAPLVSTSIRIAEMMKYTSNTWHALKVCFANEIGNLCKRLGVDSHEVMDIFCRDEKLNLSSYYLKPGFAFGGSCLPKDVRALQYRAKELDVEVPVIQSILPSNRLQIQHAFDQVIDTGKKRIGLLGFSFKAGTDDLRESPVVILAEALLGKGLTLRIYDKNVSLARLVGANKQYIEEQIPHLSSLLCDTIHEVIDRSEVIVVGNQAPEFTPALAACRADQIVIDLVRLPLHGSLLSADYRGNLLVKAIALMYHDVVDAGRDDSSGFPGGDCARYKLTLQRFDQHLCAIRAAGVRAPAAVDAVSLRSDPAPLLLTFDDGGASAMKIADRLDALGWRGHFFVSGAFVNRPAFLTRAEICDLRRRGHVIGSHSYSHPLRMGRLPFQRIRDEWTQSAALLSDIVGEAVVAASVPGGHYSRTVARAAQEAGLRFLFTSAPTIRARRFDDLVVLGRYVVRRTTDPELAAAVAAGSIAPRFRQLAVWEMRRVAKTVAGGTYLTIRNRLLGRSDEVCWGDELTYRRP